MIQRETESRNEPYCTFKLAMTLTKCIKTENYHYRLTVKVIAKTAVTLYNIEPYNLYIGT